MTKNMHFKILKYILKMKYPAINPAKFLKPESEPEPDIEAGYPAGSGFSRISGRFLVQAYNFGNFNYEIQVEGEEQDTSRLF